MLDKPSRLVCNNCAQTKQGDECEDCIGNGCSCSCRDRKETMASAREWLETHTNQRANNIVAGMLESYSSHLSVRLSQLEKEVKRLREKRTEQIEYMVSRFLSWRLPENFNPDGGISFERVGNAGTPYAYERQPAGTNLLDAQQAEQMVRYMIDGMPSALDTDVQTSALGGAGSL